MPSIKAFNSFNLFGYSIQKRVVKEKSKVSFGAVNPKAVSFLSNRYLCKKLFFSYFYTQKVVVFSVPFIIECIF